MNPEGNGRGWSLRLDPPAARASASRRRSGCRTWGLRPAARRRCLGREQGSDRERGAAPQRRVGGVRPPRHAADGLTLPHCGGARTEENNGRCRDGRSSRAGRAATTLASCGGHGRRGKRRSRRGRMRRATVSRRGTQCWLPSTRLVGWLGAREPGRECWRD